MDTSKLLTRLLELTRNLSTMVDLETYLQSILSASTELTESETASLLEYDESSHEFYFKFMPWIHLDALNDARIPIYGSVAGWVFLHVKPLAIDEAKKDIPRYVKIDSIDSFNPHSVLGVPLILHGRPIGVFQVFNKIAPYTDEDITILETLTSLATTAMQYDLLGKNVQSSQDEAHKLEQMKSEFIAITSHELRTPLGLILGHSTFLRELVKDEHQEQVDTIIRSASKLKEIIESLSSVDNQMTGMATLHSRKVSVSRIIDDTVASFRDTATQKGVQIKAEKQRDQDLLVEADGSKIAIALSNIVKNAIGFTNEGGQIIIHGEQQPNFVQVTVEDNGVGIPAKDIPHVFDRFYQVESHLTRRHGGMGLGLSVAKAMVGMHGGRIWIESIEGAGSKIHFLLPIEANGDENKPASPVIE